MAATTITRSTWTDGASGTLIDNAALGTDVYDRIDALFTSDFRFGALVHAEGLGTHTWDAGGTGGNIIRVRNSTAGTGNYVALHLGTDTDADAGRLEAYTSTFTETGAIKQDGLALRSLQDGGLSISAEHASGVIRLYGGGTTIGATVNSSGVSFDQAPDFAASAGAAPDLSRGYPEALVKAWAHISNSGSVTVNDHYNIDTGATTRTAAGRVSVAFDTDLAISNYAVIAMPITTTSQVVATVTSLAVGSVEVRITNSAGTLTDTDFTVVVIGE